MAARVSIEGAAFSDERYEDLAALAGLADADHARGKMARLWSQCTLENAHVVNNQMVIRVLGSNGIQALIGSRLGEQVDADHVRIKGAKGRIEWLHKLRENGKKGGRPAVNNGAVPKPIGYPIGSRELNPLTLTLTTALVTDDPEPPISPPSRKNLPGNHLVNRQPAKRAKPGAATEPELESVRVVLEKLGQHSGVRYAGATEHSRLIVAQLRGGVTELDLRKVVVYCAEKLDWKNKPEMQSYLRPETLFGPKSIARYLDAARSWFAEDK